MHAKISRFVGEPRAIIVVVFLVSILYGDVWLGITVPVSMLLLPVVFLLYIKDTRVARIPPGFVLLLGLAVPIACQALLGRPVQGKSDAVVYLPIAYSMATMFVLQSVRLSEVFVWRSLLAGGIVTSIAMLSTAAFLPTDRYLVPGQNFALTQSLYRQQAVEAWRARQKEELRTESSREPRRREGHRAAEEKRPQDHRLGADENDIAALSGAELGLTISPFESGFYGYKRLMRNALGQSNYIAVFLVFLFTVSLFYLRLPAAGFFGVAAAGTLSRTALVFMVIATCLWLLSRRGVRTRALATATLAVGVAGVVAVLVLSGPFVAYLPTSITNRSASLQGAFAVVTAHPIVGAPRSHILQEFNLNIVWTPHNFLLWAASLFGVIGLIVYVAFLVVCLVEIQRQSDTSPMWRGIFIGLVLLIAWGLLEPVALTPAFDVLLAALYTLARNQRGVAVLSHSELACARP